MEYLEIFSACIQTYQTKLDVNSLISFCYEVKRKHSEGVNLSNSGGWQSGNIKDNSHPEFIKLMTEVQRAAEVYHKKLQFKKEYKQELCNIWININGKGHSNEFHVHPMSAISGTFYLKDSIFPIKFKHPYEEIAPYYWDGKYIETYNALNAGQWSITPKKNTIIMFPPWLYHKVMMNEKESDRISIAFNTEFVTNEWGKYEKKT